MNFSKLIMDFSDVLHEFVKIDTSISCCYMDLSKLIHRFLLVLTRMICQNWYMDLLKLLEAVHIYYILQSQVPRDAPPSPLYPLSHNIWTAPYLDMSKLFDVFLALCKTKTSWDWPKFQSLWKLLLWTKGVEWVKVLNALGPLCLCQWFL